MREFVDEIMCDVVPMDCTDILFGIPFLHDRKATIIPYQGKCILSMDDKSIVIRATPTPRVTSLLVNKAQAQRLVKASQKYILIIIRGHHESLLGTQADTVSAIHDEAKGRQVQHILQQYEDVFRSPGGLPPERAIDHGIDLEPGDSFPNSGLYRRSVMENEEIRRQLSELMEMGHIKPSASPCGSPVLLVPKKDGS